MISNAAARLAPTHLSAWLCRATRFGGRARRGARLRNNAAAGGVCAGAFRPSCAIALEGRCIQRHPPQVQRGFCGRPPANMVRLALHSHAQRGSRGRQPADMVRLTLHRHGRSTPRRSHPRASPPDKNAVANVVPRRLSPQLRDRAPARASKYARPARRRAEREASARAARLRRPVRKQRSSRRISLGRPWLAHPA